MSALNRYFKHSSVTLLLLCSMLFSVNSIAEPQPDRQIALETIAADFSTWSKPRIAGRSRYDLLKLLYDYTEQRPTAAYFSLTFDEFCAFARQMSNELSIEVDSNRLNERAFNARIQAQQIEIEKKSPKFWEYVTPDYHFDRSPTTYVPLIPKLPPRSVRDVLLVVCQSEIGRRLVHIALHRNTRFAQHQIGQTEIYDKRAVFYYPDASLETSALHFVEELTHLTNEDRDLRAAQLSVARNTYLALQGAGLPTQMLSHLAALNRQVNTASEIDRYLSAIKPYYVLREIFDEDDPFREQVLSIPEVRADIVVSHNLTPTKIAHFLDHGFNWNFDLPLPAMSDCQALIAEFGADEVWREGLDGFYPDQE